MKSTEIYVLTSIDVGGYEICGTGFTAKEAMDAAWKAYRKAGFNDFSRKAEWLKYHDIEECSCQKITVGEGWVE